MMTCTQLFAVITAATAIGSAIGFAACWFCFRPLFAFCEEIHQRGQIRMPRD